MGSFQDFVCGECTKDKSDEDTNNNTYQIKESYFIPDTIHTVPKDVTDIKVESVEQKEFTYGDQNDSSAYHVKVTWDYTDNFEMILPDNDEFTQIDFSIDRSEDVRRAETNE